MWSNGTLEVSLEVKNSDDKFKGIQVFIIVIDSKLKYLFN